MGYAAPSADDVYRYALRLDRYDRSLTDRFSLSILFVNDMSPVCCEFLERYCVDLCLRTADRIRFIFFSDLPQSVFHEIAEKINRGYMSGRQGMLQSILSMMGPRLRSVFNPFDHEYDPWRSLRPKPFEPLRTFRDIRQHIDWQSDMKTAMPGIGESLRFAQRLGIGHLVPCFLVFSDIGDLRLDVLPIAGLSAEKAYSHVRNWVDQFYAKNREVIEHWKKVEKSIIDLCQEASRSLEEIREWSSQRLKIYRQLQTISRTILMLEKENVQTWIQLAGNLQEDFSLPYEVRQIFASLLTDLNKLAEREGRCSALRAACDRIRSASDSAKLQNVLNNLKCDLFPRLGLDTPKRLNDALYELCVWLRSHQSPRDELKKWWIGHGSTRALSFKKFQQLRKVWIESGITLTDDTTKECQVLVQAAQSLSPWQDASGGAAVVLDAIMSHYGFGKNRETWLHAFNGFHRHVTNYLHYTCNSLPAWLRNENPTLLIRDALPPLGQLLPRRWDFEEYLGSVPLVRDAMDRAMEKYQSALSTRNCESISFAQGLRPEIERYVDILAAQNAVGEDERRSVTTLALLQLRHRRAYLERELCKSQEDAQKEKVPVSTMDRSVLLCLVESLNEYREITQSIEFPHRKDPAIVRIHPMMDLSTAIGIKGTSQEPSADAKLRDNVDQALKQDAACRDTWQKTRTQKIDWTPSTRLSEKLLSCLGRRRTEEILRGYPGRDIEAQVKSALDNHSLREILNSLDDCEIASILLSLSEKDSSVPESAGIPKHEKINRIVAEIGKYSGGFLPGTKETKSEEPYSRILNERIAKDEFDVFLAHNSLDKEDVLEICRALMSKGIHPWLDSEQIPPGQWFQDVIQDIIPRVKSAAIFIGRHGIGSWQAVELRAFISQCVERRIPVIPVLLPQTKEIPQELLFLRGLNYVRFENDIQDATALGKLVWGITGRKRPKSVFLS